MITEDDQLENHLVEAAFAVHLMRERGAMTPASERVLRALQLLTARKEHSLMSIHLIGSACRALVHFASEVTFTDLEKA